MRFPVVLRWRRSPPLAALLVLLHLAALAVLAFTALETTTVALVAVFIFFSGLHAGFVWRASAGELSLHADGRCQFRPPGSVDFSDAEVLWHARWPAIVTLGVRTVEPPSRRVLVGALGALSADEERWLRLWLRCCVAADAPGPDPGTG